MEHKEDKKLLYPALLEDAFNYNIYRSARILRMKFKRDMNATGLEITQEQYFILFKLWKKDGQSQVDLADDIFKDNPNITRVLDNLIKKYFIYRKIDEIDRRKSTRLYIKIKKKQDKRTVFQLQNF